MWLVLISTRPRSSAAGCSTRAISRAAMNRPVRTGLPGARHLADLDDTARRDDLDPAAGLGRDDVERLDALARIDHGLDSVALHRRMLRPRSGAGAAERGAQVVWTAISKVAL